MERIKKVAFIALMVFVAVWVSSASVSLFTASSYSSISPDNRAFGDSIILPADAKVEFCYGIGRAETAGRLLVCDTVDNPQMVEGVIVWSRPADSVKYLKVLHNGRYYECSTTEDLTGIETGYASYIQDYFTDYTVPEYKVDGTWGQVKYLCSGAITRSNPVYYYMAKTDRNDRRKQAEAEIAYSYMYYFNN